MNGFRLYHVVFAASVALAWLTAESLGLVHAWTGYAIAALILLRLILSAASVAGFSLTRLKPRFRAQPHGKGGLRNPAIGHLLTLLLLSAVAATAGTGIIMDKGGTLIGQSIRLKDDDKREDPGSSDRARHEDEEEGEEGILAEVHETTGNALLPLVALHVLWMLLFRFDLARFVLFLPRRRPA